MGNIFEKILYAQKVTNDNIVVLNEKIDVIIGMLTNVEDSKPETAGVDENGQ